MHSGGGKEILEESKGQVLVGEGAEARGRQQDGWRGSGRMYASK